MRRIDSQSWSEVYCGLVVVEVDGWVITFYNDCDALDYCHSCYSPDNREYIFDSCEQFGTNPVELLSTWEHTQLEKLLTAL